MAEPRWPTYTAAVAGAAYATAVQMRVYNPSGNSVADALVFVIGAPIVAVLSLFLGLFPSRVNGLVGVAVLTVALEWGDPNPLPAMITVGFWLVGTAVGAHRRMARALRIRAYELESGREAYTREALRYESTNIARELHDIVAHNLTVIVIQASAGRRLALADHNGDQLLDTIIELADQARADIDGLSRLLDQPGHLAVPLTSRTLDELLSRATATGSPITCDVPAELDQLPGHLGAILYRIVQEGLTNAIKHAPGAPIHITIAPIGSAADIEVVVTNAPPRGRNGALVVPGSGRGIVGLTERVHVVNGVFSSGPTPQGGWQLSVSLPRPARVATQARGLGASDHTRITDADGAASAGPVRTARPEKNHPEARRRTSRSAR